MDGGPVRARGPTSWSDNQCKSDHNSDVLPPLGIALGHLEELSVAAALRNPGAIFEDLRTGQV
jgi:hypothetical protein